MKLTPKQKAFADYYIQLGNATEAAIKAGYSKRTSKETGYENLTKPHIKSYIDKRLEEIESERIADAKEVMEYLTSAMRGEITEEVVVTENIGDFMSEAKTMRKEIGAKERNKAAELLGKRYRLFTDKIENDTNVTVNSTPKLDSILKQLEDEDNE